MEWTTPDQLERAAETLAQLVEDGASEVKPLVDLYEPEAPGVEPPPAELAKDLADVARIAEYARSLGAQKVTLGYYW